MRDEGRAAAIRRRAAAVAMALLVASSAPAEVRVAQGAGDAPGLTLEVRPTERGPWSPLGAPHPTVLNPMGDILGEGMPGHASAGNELMAAWLRPAAHDMRLAVTDGLAWTEASPVPAPGALGSPLVRRLGDGWLVAWRDERSTWLVPLSAGGQAGEALEIGPGVPVDVIVLGDAAHVLLLDAAGGLSAAGVLFSIIPEIPEDILAYDPVLLGSGRLALPEGRAAAPKSWPEGSFVYELTHLDEESAVALWWSTPRTLHAVLLHGDGLVGAPVTLHAPGRGLGFPRSLVREALEDLAGD